MTALYEAHALGLIRLAVVMLGDRPAAEDVVQEAFCGLYRRWHALSEEANARAYVRSSVINGCRTALRRRVRQLTLAGFAEADQPGEADSAESAVLLGEEHRQVLLAIRRLPSRQRETQQRRSELRAPLVCQAEPWPGRHRPIAGRAAAVGAGRAADDRVRALPRRHQARHRGPGPTNNKREPDLTEVTVITLATGATLTWTGNGTIGFGPDDARSLSWTANERALAFDWAASAPGVHTGIWLLNLETGGGSLLARSREAVTLTDQASVATAPLPATTRLARSTPPTCQENSIITSDGSSIVCGASTALNETVKPKGGRLQRGAETAYFEYSAASGKVTRVLGHWTFGRVGALSVEVLWSNASGRVPYRRDPGQRRRAGRRDQRERVHAAVRDGGLGAVLVRHLVKWGHERDDRRAAASG